jgi:hypothetical protein
MTRILVWCASLLILAGIPLAHDARADATVIAKDGKLVVKGFECKSASLDTVEREAVVGAVEQAVREELKTEMASKKASQKQKAFQALNAAAQEAADALKGNSKLVKYEKIDGPRKRVGAPGYIVITAEVDVARIRQLYKAASAEPLGSVMVVIAEEMQAAHVENEVGIRPANDSKIAAAVERELINQGYRVINGNQIKEIQDIKADWAKLDGKDLKTIQSIATKQKADIIVTGVSKVVGPESRKIEGLNDMFYAWMCDATGRAFFSDNAQEIAVMTTADLPKSQREALDRVRDAGSALALEKAGTALADMFVKSMLLAGAPDVNVTITGVDAPKYKVLKALLEKIAGADNVTSEFNHSVMTAVVKDVKADVILNGLMDDQALPGDKEILEIESKTGRDIAASIKPKPVIK